MGLNCPVNGGYRVEGGGACLQVARWHEQRLEPDLASSGFRCLEADHGLVCKQLSGFHLMMSKPVLTLTS